MRSALGLSNRRSRYYKLESFSDKNYLRPAAVNLVTISVRVSSPITKGLLMLTLDLIRQAQMRIAGRIHRTPVITSRSFDERCGCHVFFVHAEDRGKLRRVWRSPRPDDSVVDCDMHERHPQLRSLNRLCGDGDNRVLRNGVPLDHDISGSGFCRHLTRRG